MLESVMKLNGDTETSPASYLEIARSILCGREKWKACPDISGLKSKRQERSPVRQALSSLFMQQ